jgi:hypothetical protein
VQILPVKMVELDREEKLSLAKSKLDKFKKKRSKKISNETFPVEEKPQSENSKTVKSEFIETVLLPESFNNKNSELMEETAVDAVLQDEQQVVSPLNDLHDYDTNIIYLTEQCQYYSDLYQQIYIENEAIKNNNEELRMVLQEKELLLKEYNEKFTAEPDNSEIQYLKQELQQLQDKIQSFPSEEAIELRELEYNQRMLDLENREFEFSQNQEADLSNAEYHQRMKELLAREEEYKTNLINMNNREILLNNMESDLNDKMFDVERNREEFQSYCKQKEQELESRFSELYQQEDRLYNNGVDSHEFEDFKLRELQFYEYCNKMEQEYEQKFMLLEQREKDLNDAFDQIKDLGYYGNERNEEFNNYREKEQENQRLNWTQKESELDSRQIQVKSMSPPRDYYIEDEFKEQFKSIEQKEGETEQNQIAFEERLKDLETREAAFFNDVEQREYDYNCRIQTLQHNEYEYIQKINQLQERELEYNKNVAVFERHMENENNLCNDEIERRYQSISEKENELDYKKEQIERKEVELTTKIAESANQIATNEELKHKLLLVQKKEEELDRKLSRLDIQMAENVEYQNRFNALEVQEREWIAKLQDIEEKEFQINRAANGNDSRYYQQIMELEKQKALYQEKLTALELREAQFNGQTFSTSQNEPITQTSLEQLLIEFSQLKADVENSKNQGQDAKEINKRLQEIEFSTQRVNSELHHLSNYLYSHNFNQSNDYIQALTELTR